MNNLNVTFLSGVETVTGSNFLLTHDNTKILIDCGLIQGERFVEEANRQEFPFSPSEIDILIVTHAHLDHVGRIPKLVKDGFKGKIYSTKQTKDLGTLVLEDATRILEHEAKEDGQKPIYDLYDVNSVFPLWQTVPYHEEISLNERLSFSLKDAGHILGSSMITFSAKENDKTVRVMFTGDLGNSPAPLLRDTESVGEVDYLIMESTYGDRNHEPKEQRSKQFEKVIMDTITRGGTLVIPTFSIDRTQVLLFELNNMVEQKRIPSIPVFVDSPMATKATAIYSENTDLFNDAVRSQIAKGDDIFSFKHLKYTITENQSRDIEKVHGPKIILAGSGMSVGGRVIGHEEKYLPDPKSTILLVGYQTAGSLGRRLSDGAKKVSIHGNKVQVLADIQTLYGYSAHKDSDHLVDFVTTSSGLKQIFVVMGEPKSAQFLAQRINSELPVKAMIPDVGRQYDLN